FAFTEAKIVQAGGKKVILHVTAPHQSPKNRPGTDARPEVRLEYVLEDGQSFLLVRTVFTNTLGLPVSFELEDDLRMDDVETRVKAGPTDLFWVHDRHFEQAYGLIVDGHDLHSRSDIRTSVLTYSDPKTGKSTVTLKKG